MKKINIFSLLLIAIISTSTFAADNTGGQATCKIDNADGLIEIGHVIKAGDLKLKINRWHNDIKKWEVELKAPDFHRVIYVQRDVQETINICGQDVSISESYIRDFWLHVAVF